MKIKVIQLTVKDWYYFQGLSQSLKTVVKIAIITVNQIWEDIQLTHLNNAEWSGCNKMLHGLKR